MSDRELLEAAAKAADIKLRWFSHLRRDGVDLEPKTAHIGNTEWSPLTDDGDALRLAVALQMDVFVRGEWAEAVAPMGAPQQVWYSATISKHEATRRAIVRAAAAMVTA